MNDDKRFIEETFPVKEVSFESAKEKNIRHGHISTLHIWWARKPLASSRATSYAALIPATDDIEERSRKRQFIIDFSKWENSLNQTMIERAREDILKANGGKPPKVLDPFGGGGSIPLEALRLGCETYSNDYNPVAVLIQKCTLEYPQKYGVVKEAGESWGELSADSSRNPLLEDVKRWGNWVLEEAKKEIGKFYPQENEGSIPVGYYWMRTIPCQNLNCGADIPLTANWWLAKKDKKKVALKPFANDGKVQFEIVENPDFDPTNGTISKAVSTCLVCGSMVDAPTARKLFREGKAGQRMVAVVLHKPGKSGKRYRIATDKDMGIFREAEEYLKEKREKLMVEWGVDPVPDETIHTPDNKEYESGGLLYNFTPILLYGMTKWGDLFNSRQKLALITFVEKVRLAHKKMIESGYDEDYEKAVVSYLALGIDRLADYFTMLTVWENNRDTIAHTFSRQALPMIWDYIEANAFSKASGDWESAMKWIFRNLENLSKMSNLSATVTQSSATSLPYPDDYFDAVITDPPYYDNVPYADLSDFFYVWLKRTIGDLYPELFSTPSTPKSNEVIAELPLLRGMNKEKASVIVKGIKTSEHFEDMLKKSFKEIHRVLKPDGIAVIVYAHKSTEGWETLINSLLDSGLIMTGAWPLHTEMATRLRAQESAALASSIYIVARKMVRQPTGFYNDVKEELKRHLNTKLEQLWGEGIGGADFFIAAIGSAIEVFGKYEKVMDYEGNIVRADRLLEDVQRIATDYAVRQILHNGFSGEISNLTRFYVLYRWNYGEAKIEFDEARKLAQSCSIDLANEWSRPGFIKKEKEFIRVLGPQDRKLEDLKNPSDMIDVLHSVLLFWEKSKHNEILSLLRDSGHGQSEPFYRVAQAVSETLPKESREKKLLDGFLAGRERLKEEVRKEYLQRRLV